MQLFLDGIAKVGANIHIEAELICLLETLMEFRGGKISQQPTQLVSAFYWF